MVEGRRVHCQYCDAERSEINLRAVPDGGAVCKDYIACQMRRDATLAEIAHRRKR